jgi:hypothetical protein
MASFPDLRPHACLAQAKRRAARSFGSLVGLLTACAVLRDLAFVAVSELATLRGKKALHATASPARGSRAFVCAFSLVGTQVAETRAA